MSVIGIDFGTASTTVAVAEGQGGARAGGVSIVLNESSGRFTPGLVCFNEGKRFLGALAQPLRRSKFKNTVSDIKRILGCKWSEPRVQKELKSKFFRSKQLDGDEIGIILDVNGTDKVFTPTQLLAMLLGNIKDFSAKYTGTPAGDVVMSVPAYYTDAQRRACMDAFAITDMKCLRLFNETTATALSYGIYKQGKMKGTEEKPDNVMFVDIGYAKMTVSIVAFRPGKMDVKATTWDRDLGGRDWDYLIARKMADEFMAKHPGIDLETKGKSWIKLVQAAEKAKKTLSPAGVPLARVRLECLYQDFDFSTTVKREDMEALAAPLVQRLAKPIMDAFEKAGLKPEDLTAVEAVGGGIRVRAVKQEVEKLIKRPLSNTLNQDECCSRGCALQCAMLSPKFRVKEYSVNDVIPYPVRLSWEQPAAADAMETADNAAENSVVIFQAGDAFPKYRRLTFKRVKSFDVTAEYEDPTMLPEGVKTRLATFNVDLDAAKPDLKDGPVQVRVFVSHDINGVFGVSSAEYMKKKEPEPEPEAKPEEAKAEEAKAAEGDKPAAKEGEAPEAAKEAEEKPAAAEGEKAPEGEAAKEGEAKPEEEAKKEEEKKEEPKKKKDKFVKVSLSVASSTSALPQHTMQQYTQAEASMQQQDRLIRERDEKRNDLEQYVYNMRDRLTEEEDFYRFIEEAPKEAFLKQLDDMEEWLYGEEGFDSSKSTFVKKLAGLEAIGGKVVARQFEFDHRAEAIAALKSTTSGYLGQVNGGDQQYEHLTDQERTKVRGECTAAVSEMEAKVAALEGKPLWEDPAVTVAMINARAQAVHTVCRPVVNRPKPKPKVEPKKEEKKAEEKPADAKAADDAKPAEEGAAAADGAKAEGEAKADAPAPAATAKEGEEEDAANMAVD